MFARCKKLVEVDPPITSTTGESVYKDNTTAISALTSIYIDLSQASNSSFATGKTSLSLLCGLSADEFTLYSGNSATDAKTFFYKNGLFANTTGSPGSDFWGPTFSIVYRCNDAIERINKSTDLNPAVKKQLLGEAKFIRAFCYFYLVNLYGELPLILTTDYKINATLSRSSKSSIYDQIKIDLKEAQDLLADNFLDGTLLKTTTERVRPSKWAAAALLSRAYLYTGDWANAEAQATSVINNVTLFDTTSLNNVFIKNSKEAVWQLQPVNSGWNTEDARLFILTSSGPNNQNPVYVSNSILNEFENGDLRKDNWINSMTAAGTTYYYPFKYKKATFNLPVTEYLMVLRLAEQYLIRAEARAQSNNLSGSQSDINVIRKRAGLANTNASDKATLLSAILHERKVELFSEWGHRWLDLKRTGTIDAVMNIITPLKASGAPWKSYQQLYPLALQEVHNDPNLSQNQGY
jgi:hypothetical protein